MTDEVLSARLKTEFLVDGLHTVPIEVDTYTTTTESTTRLRYVQRTDKHTLMRSRIIITPVLQKLKELLRPTFLKETHQRALDSLHLGTRNLGDPAITVHKATSDLFELEITCHVGVHENLGEFTRSDDELWYKVDGVVPIASELGRGRLVWAELAVQLTMGWFISVFIETLGYVRGGITCVRFKLALSPP